MAKLHFYYSAMNAGKSTTLLQANYNYLERGLSTLLFLPSIDKRAGSGVISSRIGLKANAVSFDHDFSFKDYIQQQQTVDCILIDEAQFLTKQQVTDLCYVTDVLNIPVLAYGLRSDFTANPFEGSKYLLILADQLIEIKTICYCGKKATMNIKVNQDGVAIRHGAQVDIGGNEKYIAVCRKHFYNQNNFAEIINKQIGCEVV
jgi:thymidine kinase